MATNAQIDNLVSMLDGYSVNGGHHLNINVFSKETLLCLHDAPFSIIIIFWGYFKLPRKKNGAITGIRRCFPSAFGLSV